MEGWEEDAGVEDVLIEYCDGGEVDECILPRIVHVILQLRKAPCSPCDANILAPRVRLKTVSKSDSVSVTVAVSE